MRVLALSNLYPPHALGGYEMSCHDVMRRWAAGGHDVTVLTTTTRLPGIADTGRQDGDVRRELRWYWDDHRITQPPVRQRWAIDRHNRQVLRRTIDEMRPDVVSVWAMGAMSLGLVDVVNAAGVPAVYVVCDEWPVYGPRLDGWTAMFRRRRARPAAALVRALTHAPTGPVEPRNATYCWLSDFVRSRVLGATGWRPEHETVTYSGIDRDDFPPRPADERPWRWRLLAVGRVEPRKGFATAVEALTELPSEATLTICGPDDGSHRAELERLAQSLRVGERVRFTSAPRSALAGVYGGADALLFTSAWEEPFGLVPVEAMSCATPVVAAATGGAREFLVDGINSLVVPPRDAGAVAAGARRLADDEHLRRRLVRGGLDTAADLTVDRLADVLEQWHAAAATRYADGEPAHRTRPVATT